MGQAEFYTQMAPYAQKAAKTLGVSPALILAQLDVESSAGTSNLAKNHNNYAGIRFVKQAGAVEYKTQGNGSFASYRSIDAFFNDYVRVMGLSRYAAVRSAMGTEAEVKALAASPWDAGHYGGNGASILSRIKKYGLEKYNAGVAPGNSKPPAPKVCPTCKRLL